MSSSPRTLNRREFLKSLGLVSAALLVPSFKAQAHFLQGVPSGTGTSLRVGAVIPTYLKDPRRATSWLNGLQFGLQNSETKLSSYTVDDRILSIVEAVRDLVQVDQADLIVGSVSPFASTQIANALQDTFTVFLNAEVGAHLMLPAFIRENVFHHTLHDWQANWAAGEWAVQTMGKRGVILATFYDAGYDTLAAFRLAFEQAGGEILQTVITHSPTETWNSQAAFAQIAALQPDFVYLMGVGSEIVELQAEYKNSPFVGHIPLVGTGFSLPNGTSTSALDTFRRDYLKAIGETPDALALLGYETSLLIHAAGQGMAETGVSLAQALSTATFDSPRGQVVMDAEIHATTASTFVDGDANLLPHLPAIDTRTARLHPGWSDIRTGWITPYFSL